MHRTFEGKLKTLATMWDVPAGMSTDAIATILLLCTDIHYY